MKRAVCLLLPGLIPLFIQACAHDPKLSGRLPRSLSGELGIYASSMVTGSPFTTVWELIDKQPAEFELPRAEESYYRLLCRFPLIDRIGSDPFRIADYGRQCDALICEADNADKVFAAALSCIGVTLISDQAMGSTLLDLPELNFPANQWNLTPEAMKLMQTTLTRLTSVLNQALFLQQQAMTRITANELAFLRDDVKRYFFENGILRFLTGPVKQQYAIAQIARKVNYALLFQAHHAVLQAITESLDDLHDLAILVPPVDDQILIRLSTSAGLVIVGGSGRNSYQEDAALLIDLGGDDLYTNNAGGTGISAFPVAISIDVAGNDEYRAKNYGSQGFGFLGAGALVDLQGDDYYFAGDYSQAGGYLGAGFLWDQAGNDRYRGGVFVQGVGLFGVGVLADRAGDDDYRAEQFTQGFGSTLGLGVLIDKTGDDRYWASVPDYGFAQGSGCGCRSYPWLKDFSFYGGFGLLIDEAGNDWYKAASFAQGASYFLSLGVLLDHHGNDYYAGSGSYSHGGGVHLTNGLLIDDDGDDVYVGAWAPNATGNDRSIGFFMDLAGNDRYYAPGGDGQSYSHKPLGLSVFIDASGDDVYQAKAYSQAYILPPITPDEWNDALFLDCGGLDSYSMEGRGNDKLWHLQKYAVGIDMQYELKLPLTADPGFTGATLKPDWLTDLKSNVADPFALAAEVDRLLALEHERAGAIVETLLSATESPTLLAALEALTVIMLDSQAKPEAWEGLCSGLSSEDKTVQATLIMTIAIHELTSCVEELVALGGSADPYIRKLLYEALGQLKAEQGLRLLRNAVQSESNAQAKGTAVSALARFEQQSDASLFIRCLSDPNEFVRMTAAYGLSAHRTEPVIVALHGQAADPSPYVQKAVGEALLRLGEREGLALMIEYLQYRALDTSSDNYGSNLGAVLMEYTNVDFGRNYEEWRAWYKAHGASFDLAANLKARQQYREALKKLRDNQQEAAAEAFERALQENPDYRKARVEYAAMLNATAWNLATAPQTPEDVAKGLSLARRCVELDSQANYLDTLAEACFQSGLREEAIEWEQKALALDPENKEFQARLLRFKEGVQ